MSPPVRAPDVRHCENCGGEIAYRRRYWQRYPKARFCSKQCCGAFHRGARHGSWTGGLIDEWGYRRISIYAFDEEHWPILRPMLRKGRVDLLEHRAVTAIRLGRSLLRTETVHHRNGNKLDNRPENLELMAGSHGRGANAVGLVCPHCHKRYDDSSN